MPKGIQTQCIGSLEEVTSPLPFLRKWKRQGKIKDRLGQIRFDDFF